MRVRRSSHHHPSLHPADLSGWRNRNHISLASIAAETKIAVRYLEAIEGGRFQVLPGGTYNVNYLRQYAQAIHFDAERLIEYYRSVAAPPAVAPAAPPSETTMGRIRSWLRSLVAQAS